MYKRVKNKQGFTVIELIVAIAIASIMIVISINLLRLTNKAHSISLEEYDLQSAIRRATEETNQAARYSRAVFAVPQTFVASTEKMDPDWNYLMVSHDGKRIISMEYDDSEGKEEFVERVLVPEHKNIRYEIFFEKESEAEADNVIKYVISAYIVDKNGEKIDEKIVYETTVESINAIQVADKGTGIAVGASPSIALAYRGDGQSSGKGKNQIAYITIIIDMSNSMNKTPNNGGNSTEETKNSRIAKLRKVLVDDGTSEGDGIIQFFSKEENVFVSVIPYANTANYPSPHANTDQSAVHPIYELSKKSESNSLISFIHTMKADGHTLNRGQGGTNTGDGLRRTYYLHENFRTNKNINPSDQVHHYIILLTDGKSTFETSYFDWTDNGYYKDTYSSVTKGKGWNQISYSRFDWQTDWTSNKNNDFLPDGNINMTLKSDYRPTNNSLTENRYYNGTISYIGTDFWGRPINQTYTGNIIEYGKKNDSFTNILLNGNGTENQSNLALIGNNYVDQVGTAIKEFNNNKGITSYIIGYESTLTNSINAIGDSIGTGYTSRYVYTNEKDFDLNEILKNIATDIMADFWLATGPQIQN